MTLIEFPEDLSVELKSFYVVVSILLNSNQFQAAQTSPNPQKTNTKVKVPVKERGASPSGIEPAKSPKLALINLIIIYYYNLDINGVICNKHSLINNILLRTETNILNNQLTIINKY